MRIARQTILNLLTLSILVPGFPAASTAHDVIVGDFDGASSNGGFVNGVWTPTASPSQLDITVDPGGSVASGDAGVPGGDVLLHAVQSMTINGAVDSRDGSGGSLQIDSGVVVNVAPLIGHGTIQLLLRPTITNIPTLNRLGIVLMIAAVLALGAVTLRAKG